MTIKIVVNGAKGKMGQAVVNAVSKNTLFNLIAETDHDDDLKEILKNKKPDVVVDFTSPHSAFNNAEIIINENIRPVIGTTGFKSDEIAELQKRAHAKKLGGIIAPNFSLGAVLMMKCAEEIAKYFPDVEIIEMHHNRKIDSPSGTAIRTAELIAGSKKEIRSGNSTTQETLPGARGASAHNVPIHSLRLPGLVAHQQVIFGGNGETLTIKHDSIDRECFMPGVLLACKKVMELDELVYGLENIL